MVMQDKEGRVEGTEARELAVLCNSRWGFNFIIYYYIYSCLYFKTPPSRALWRN